MRKILLGALALVGWNITRASASTVMVVSGSCVSVTDANGCLFSGNISTLTSGNSSYLLAQNAYDAYNNIHWSAGPDITLTPITDTAYDNLATLTGAGGTSGTWSLAGYSVDYVAIKAGNYFDLYELPTPVSTGVWDTYDIPAFRGSSPTLSHIVFFGSQISNLNNAPVGPVNAVPEPGTWLLMLLGFGLTGGALRSRRARSGGATRALPSP